MELKDWNMLQYDLFKQYGIDQNIQLLVYVARDIAYIKTIEYDIDKNVLISIIENAILNHAESIINKYQNKAVLEYVYKNTCSNNSINANCSILDFQNHLISKIELYKSFHTESLKNKIKNIIKFLKV